MFTVIPKIHRKGHWELHTKEDSTGLLSLQITVKKTYAHCTSLQRHIVTRMTFSKTQFRNN